MAADDGSVTKPETEPEVICAWAPPAISMAQNHLNILISSTPGYSYNDAINALEPEAPQNGTRSPGEDKYPRQAALRAISNGDGPMV
jgi:hypothetical protein